MVKITYEYQGLVAVADSRDSTKFLDEETGDYVSGHYEPTWYEGSEMCSDKNLKRRLFLLECITNPQGDKVYRNIQVVKVKK